MAPGFGLIVWPKPGRVLTIWVGEMALRIAMAERRYCRSIQTSSGSEPRILLTVIPAKSRDPLNKCNLGSTVRVETTYWVPAFAAIGFTHRAPPKSTAGRVA